MRLASLDVGRVDPRITAKPQALQPSYRLTGVHGDCPHSGCTVAALRSAIAEAPEERGTALNSIGPVRRTLPPASWNDPVTHYERALSAPWYRHVIELTDLLHTTTVEFWKRRGVRAAYLPVTTGSLSSPMGLGSGSTPVPVDILGTRTYLADSMQFLLEYACRLTKDGAYYVMPSFRGERADSTHLGQFFHSQAEIPGGLDDGIAVVEAYICELATAFRDQAGDLVAHLAGHTTHLLRPLETGSFRRIEFGEAAALLEHHPNFVDERIPDARSLTRAGERELMNRLGEFLWVTNMDHLSVPFSQAYADDSRRTALNGDLLFGIGETVGCGERHALVQDVRSALAIHGVEEADYEWYVRMRDLAPLRTAGFGMGVERFMLWLLQHQEIRDIPLLLRFNGQRIDP